MKGETTLKLTYSSMFKELWPSHSDDYQVFLEYFRTEVTLFCVTSPLFLGISLDLFKTAFESHFGLGVTLFLLGILFLIPWVVVPATFIWLHKRTWPYLTSWGLLNIIVIVFWFVLFHDLHF